MAILPISRHPDPVLREKAPPVVKVTSEIKTLAADMIETMYSSPATIGLAAPQVGHSVRLVVLDVSVKEKKHGLLILLNPVLLCGEGDKICREGCLSLPDYTGNVKRHEKVVVRAKDLEWRPVEIETDGIEAICLQHEIDHIDGMIFLDRVASLKTDVFRRKRYQKPL